MLVRQGAIGVGTIHQALIEAGETVADDERESGLYGASTELAVRDFQAHHVDQSGHALAVDGICGPATLWALQHPNGGANRFTAPGWRCEPSQAREAVRRVLEVAVDELGLGVTEQPDGSNRGPRVDVYTAPDLGIPWCAAFASWCYARRDGGSPFGRFTGSWQFREWGRKTGRVLGQGLMTGAAAMPQAGDVAIILREDPRKTQKEPPGHTMLIAGIADDGRLITIEGNSGNAVRGLVRPLDAPTFIVRPIPLV